MGTNKPWPMEPARLAVQFIGAPSAIDRENNVLRGYVVAERGHFKTPGRGQFTDASLAAIVTLMQAHGSRGTKSHFTHPDMSSDGLGTFLGRALNPRLDGPRVRADLHFDPTAANAPGKGDLAGYVMDLAESDPEALGSSLILRADKTYELDDQGRVKKDEKGEDIPPVWTPTRIFASDIVDDGDAVHGGLLAAGAALPDLWQGAEMLDRVFAGQPREVVESRLLDYLSRYLERKFGPGPDLELRRRRLALWEKC